MRRIEAPAFEPLESDIQRILVEDFTAHQCGNCPPAAVNWLVDALAEHPDHIVPLAIHAGEFGRTNVDYPIDWTCEEGDVFWEFDLEFQLNPIGRVNRVNSATKPTFLWWTNGMRQWTPSWTRPLRLACKWPWTPLHRELTIHVHTTWFEDGGRPRPIGTSRRGKPHRGAPAVVPHRRPSRAWTVEDYDHEHVLRGSVTGA